MNRSFHSRVIAVALLLSLSGFALFARSIAQDISGGSSSELASAAEVESKSGRGVFTTPKNVTRHAHARLENKTVARAGNTSRQTVVVNSPDTSGGGEQNDNRPLGSTKPLGGAPRRVAGPEELNAQGDEAFDAGQYEKAADLYKKAIKQRAQFPEAYQNLSEAYFNLGKFNEAVEAAQKAISQKSEFADAYVALGNAYLRLDRLTDADWSRAGTQTSERVAHRLSLSVCALTELAL